MNITLECMPCFVRHTLEVLREFSPDENLNENVMRNVLKKMSQLDFSLSPPEFAAEIHAFIREQLKCDDPYFAIKNNSNELAARLVLDLQKNLEQASDPLRLAVLYSIAGNIIDSGVSAVTPDSEVRKSIEMAEKEHPAIDDYSLLREKVFAADKILVLGDNAGEVFFDRLLLERLPVGKSVAYAVKGGAILNDAVRADAEAAGLSRCARIIENGTRSPGTPIKQVSSDFMNCFAAADVIIAKGQANFETLSHLCDPRMFFLLRAKCDVIAGKIGVPKGSFVILCNQRKII